MNKLMALDFSPKTLNRLLIALVLTFVVWGLCVANANAATWHSVRVSTYGDPHVHGDGPSQGTAAGVGRIRFRYHGKWVYRNIAANLGRHLPYGTIIEVRHGKRTERFLVADCGSARRVGFDLSFGGAHRLGIRNTIRRVTYRVVGRLKSKRSMRRWVR